MSKKLLADPAVAALVEKREAAATKAEQKRILGIIKNKIAATKECEDKTEKKIVGFTLRNLTTDIKAISE